MPKIRKSETLSIPLVIVSDFFSWFLSLAPGILAWSLTIALALRLQNAAFWAYVFFIPIVASLALIAIIVVIRLFFPKMKPGVYDVGMSRGGIAWFLQFSLNRAVRLSMLWQVINSFHTLKYLYFRAMGARIAFGIHTSLDITLVDLPLLTIEPGCTLSERVHISCHSFTGDKLLLKPVEIGKNVFIGMGTVIGPATTIGAGTWIGMSNQLGIDRIPENSRIESHAWPAGNPDKQRPSS
jgi:hypothetical protein